MKTYIDFELQKIMSYPGAIIWDGDRSVVALAPSKKTNVLFLEKIAPSRVTHARVCCEDSAQRKTSKMPSEITFVGDEEIQFLSSMSLPNLRQALGENFLDSDSGYEDCTSDSDDGSESFRKIL